MRPTSCRSTNVFISAASIPCEAFDYGDISPIDPVTGERIGGDKMWYTNWEIIFPILEKQGLQGVVFFDAGQCPQ